MNIDRRLSVSPPYFTKAYRVVRGFFVGFSTMLKAAEIFTNRQKSGILYVVLQIRSERTENRDGASCELLK